jgi:ubiquinone/menaquinone biosynthesis C-methylase UbiE
VIVRGGNVKGRGSRAQSSERFYAGSSSLFVRAYDALHHQPPLPIVGDVAFYLRLARDAAAPVLELACGTGRIAVALAESGIDITGIDVSDGMLAIARRKREALAEVSRARLRLLAGDMCELDLDGRFGLIIVAFRSFQHLLTIDLQRKALAAMRRHLAPEGRLALHLFDPRLDLLIEGMVALPKVSGIDPATQRRYTAEVLRASFDHAAQVRRDLWQYREFSPAGELLEQATQEMALRWTYRWELHHLLTLGGFVVEAEYSDFAGSPPAYGKELVVLARRSG